VVANVSHSTDPDLIQEKGGEKPEKIAEEESSQKKYTNKKQRLVLALGDDDLAYVIIQVA